MTQSTQHPPWRRFALPGILVITLVVAGSAALGLRSRAAAARLPPPPSVAGKPNALVAHLEQANAVARRSPQSAEAVGGLGMAYHADLFYEQAAAAYTLAAELDAADWRWPYYRALVYLERGDLAPASDALHIVIRLNPSVSLAWWRLGEAAFKRADFKEAATAYARADSPPLAASDPPGVDAYARVGRSRVALSLGDPRTAADILTRLLEVLPRFGVAHRVLAEVYRSQGRDKDAERHGALGAALRAYAAPTDPLMNALAAISRSSVFLLRQAAALDLNRAATRREQLVRRALEFDPANPDVVYELGALLQQLRRPTDALPYFVRHLDLVADDTQTLVQIGKCYTDLGRLDEAETTLRKTLAAGDDAVGFYNLGVVLEQRDHLDEAEASYRRAVRLSPGLASARNNLGGLLAARGRLNEAATYLLESIRLDGASANAYVNLSAVRLQQGQVDDAVRLARLAIEADPRHADAHANLGVALARLGRVDEARQALQAALSINPRHANARENLKVLTSRN